MVSAFKEGQLFREAGLNGKNTQLGATAHLKIFSGAVPTNCASTDPTGLLVDITLPNPPFATASGGAMAKAAGAWTASASAGAPTTAVSYRIYDSSSVCQMQGNVTDDLVLNNASISTGQTVTVTSYTLTAGNA